MHVAANVSSRVMLAGTVLILVVEHALRNLLVPLIPGEGTVQVALGTEWLLFVVLLGVWVPRLERLTWRSVGIGPWRRRYLWLGVGWFVAATVASAVVGLLLRVAGLDSLADLQPKLTGYAWPTLLALGLTGAVVEEVLYRGYLIERVIALSGRVWVAAAISWVAFTAVHLGFFGPGPTLNVAVLSAAFVWLYVRERSIWPVVLMHGLNSLFAYLLVPLLT